MAGFVPPVRTTSAMGCSGSRSDLVKPEDLLTEATTEERSPLKQLARDAQGTETGPGAAAAGSAESCSRRLPNEIEPEPVIELVQTDSPAPAATEQEEVAAGSVAAALPVRDEDGEAFEAVTQPEKAEGELPVVGTITDKEVVEAATQPKKAEGELPASGTTDKEVVEAVTPPEKAEGELPASGNTDKEVFEAVAQPEKKEGEPPELGWFEAATLGNLKDLQLHVKRSTAQGSLSELLESVDAATGTATEDFRKTALHLSAQEGRVECCQWLLEAKADAMAMTKKKATALHLAAAGGHLAVLQLLLEVEPSALRALDLWRCSPLHRAAELGKSEVASFLLQRRADPQKSDREGNSPLHYACSSGCVELVKELVKQQVPLDFANNDGFAPLDLCVRKQQAEVGDLLVAAGAKLVKDMRKTPPTMAIAAASGLPFFCSYMLKSPDAKKQLMAVDAEGRSPLLRAVALGHGGAVERLLDSEPAQQLALLRHAVPPRGLAPVHVACAAGQLEMLELLLRRKAAVEQLDAQGSTGLFHAAEARQLPLLQRLLELKLRPEQRNDCERTALHLAAASGEVPSCRALVNAAKDPEKLMQCEDWEGATAVHLGIKAGYVEVCKFFMDQKADLQQPLDFGVTPLQLAAGLGHYDVLQLLLSDLSDPLALRRALQGRTGDGRGAWLVACGNGHLSCARALWSAASSAGIDLVTEQDRTQRRAMTLAALGGHLDMCKWLLEIGAADMKERDSCQWTPLHAASAEGHTELVDWLLKQGADVSALDEDGHTAHTLARRRGCAQVEQLLRRFAAQAAGA